MENSPDQMLEHIKGFVAAEAALEDHWDGPPHLSLLLEDPTGRVLTQPFPLSTSFWSAAPPYRLLVVIARGIATLGIPFDIPDGCNVVGVAFYAESWMLHAPKDQNGTEPPHWDGRLPIRDHPDRVEVKMIGAQTLDGTRYIVIHERGGGSALEARHTPPDSAPEVELQGRILDALALICHSLAAVL